MASLIPKDAINTAIAVYGIENSGSDPRGAFAPFPNLTDRFEISKQGRFESKSGAFILKSRTGFGIVAKGKGRFQDEVLIGIRGTRGAYDWITDGNTGIQLSRTGKFVHAGFNRVFKEFEPDLRRFFAHNNPSKVHCVGHSLGGALAGLTADWLSQKNIAQPYLYTFGSPRIGFQPFAERLTHQVGNENIFRVHHHNDIVSLIPVWPFVHIPQPGISCCLQSNGYSPVSAHYKENYFDSVRGVTDWKTIRTPQPLVTHDKQITNWLSWNTVNVLSSYTLNMISGAISYILKVAGVSGQMVFISGVSVLDQLSYALDKAVKTSKEVAGLVKSLMQKILSTVGRTVKVGADIAVEFIRWVFNLLSAAVNRMASLALRATG